MPTQTGSTHGGARPRAGHPPKALTYAVQAEAIEQTIVEALPSIVGKLIEMAMDGDLKAARYLIDRILGRVARLTSPPSMDRPTIHTDKASVTTDQPTTKSAPSAHMTLEEMQQVAFGPQTGSTLQIIKRDPISPIGRLNLAGAQFL